MPIRRAILTEEELESIIMSACTQGSKTEKELTAIVQWAEQARVDTLLLKEMLAGRILPGITGNGEVFFQRPEDAPS